VNAKLTFELVDYWLSKLTLRLAVHTTDIDVCVNAGSARSHTCTDEWRVAGLSASFTSTTISQPLTYSL